MRLTVQARDGFGVPSGAAHTATFVVGNDKPLVAIARLTIVSPTGRTVKQSLKVTLIGKPIRR